jgi:hypothetical protein
MPLPFTSETRGWTIRVSASQRNKIRPPTDADPVVGLRHPFGRCEQITLDAAVTRFL